MGKDGFSYYFQASYADLYNERDSLRRLMAVDTETKCQVRVYGLYGLYGRYGHNWATLKEARMGETFYVVTDAQGNKKQAYSSESVAITGAEAFASQTPGQCFYVMKTIAKSHALKPVTTTRL